jgi:hypothetical protein
MKILPLYRKSQKMFADSDDPDVRAAQEELSATEPAPLAQGLRVESCARCGAIGHSHVRCRAPLPTFTDMQANITQKIEAAIASAPPEWVSDDFGLYLPGDNESNGKSWPDGDFCFNCGAFGHTIEACLDPSFERVEREFGDTLEDKSSRSVLEKEAIIKSLTSAHRQRQGERDQL